METYGLIARKHGLSIDESLIRRRLTESFQQQERHDAETGWKTSEEREADRWRQIVGDALRESAHGDACFVDLWEWYRHPAAWTVHPETEAVLNELTRRGLVVGMASNFDARLANIIKGIPELTLVADRCIISSIVGWRKPSRQFFDEVIRLAGCPAEQILLVGDDARNDFEGARAAGLRAVLIDPAGTTFIPDRITTLFEIL